MLRLQHRASLLGLVALLQDKHIFDFELVTLPTIRTPEKTWCEQLYNVVAQGCYCHAHAVAQSVGPSYVFIIGHPECVKMTTAIATLLHPIVREAIQLLWDQKDFESSQFAWNRNCGVGIVHALAHSITVGRRNAEVEYPMPLEDLGEKLILYYAAMTEQMYEMQIHFKLVSEPREPYRKDVIQFARASLGRS